MPAYKLSKSESDSYSGPALVGEAGPELRKKKDGSFKLYSQPPFDYLNAGDQIYTANQRRTSSRIGNVKR